MKDENTMQEQEPQEVTGGATSTADHLMCEIEDIGVETAWPWYCHTHGVYWQGPA